MENIKNLINLIKKNDFKNIDNLIENKILTIEEILDLSILLNNYIMFTYLYNKYIKNNEYNYNKKHDLVIKILMFRNKIDKNVCFHMLKFLIDNNYKYNIKLALEYIQDNEVNQEVKKLILKDYDNNYSYLTKQTKQAKELSL